MEIEVVEALEADKPLVARLLELNAHDFSAIDGRDLGPTGEYGYPYLDLYWSQGSRRRAFVIRVDGQIAGCSLVRTAQPDTGHRHQMAEFFIVAKYRRRGAGTAAARRIFAGLPGSWAIHQVPGNDSATAFWRRVVPAGSSETVDETGTTQHVDAPE